MAKGYGVEDENLHITSEPKCKKDIMVDYKIIMKKSSAMSTEEIPHVIMFYCGGHGASQEEK